MDSLGRLDHPSAQEILEDVRKRYPHISRGTVYRNLNLLEKDGLVKRLFFPDSPDRFDIDTKPHNHVRCIRCGRIFDLKSDGLKNVDRQMEEETGFLIKGHSITFLGVCPACRLGKKK